jgi:hypothetical protein
MDSQQIPIVRRNLRLDGVQYHLTAVMVDGGDYEASWYCPECRVGDNSKLNYPHSAAALDWAQNCAAIHEQLVHCK